LKQWFPFTDYDFYGYLACGLVVLFAFDYFQTGGQYLIHDHWSFIQGALIVSLAYVVGQIVAMPSSIILEHGFARGLLRPPAAVLMSNKPTMLEGFISRFLVGPYYSPFPEGTRTKILVNAETDTGLQHHQLLANTEEIFTPAYNAARKIEDSRKRMDDFRNQYGFNRNMCFSGLIATALLFIRAWEGADKNAWGLAVMALILSLGMLIRFLKFYTCFAREVLRSYAFSK